MAEANKIEVKLAKVYKSSKENEMKLKRYLKKKLFQFTNYNK